MILPTAKRSRVRPRYQSLFPGQHRLAGTQPLKRDLTDWQGLVNLTARFKRSEPRRA